MYSSEIDTLHIMGLFNISYATDLANLGICHILRHSILSVYVSADTYTANKAKKLRKINIINTLDLHFYVFFGDYR